MVDDTIRGFDGILERAPIDTRADTFASLALSEGVPVLNVSRMLGHATAAMTLDVYGHVLPGQQQDAARRGEQAIGG